MDCSHVCIKIQYQIFVQIKKLRFILSLSNAKNYQFKSIGSFTWTSRKFNQVAHCVAELSHQGNLQPNWIWVRPQQLQRALSKDRSGSVTAPPTPNHHTTGHGLHNSGQEAQASILTIIIGTIPCPISREPPTGIGWSIFQYKMTSLSIKLVCNSPIYSLCFPPLYVSLFPLCNYCCFNCYVVPVTNQLAVLYWPLLCHADLVVFGLLAQFQYNP